MEKHKRNEHLLRKTLIASTIVTCLAIPVTFLSATANSVTKDTKRFLSFDLSKPAPVLHTTPAVTTATPVVKETPATPQERPAQIPRQTKPKTAMVYWKTVRAKITAYSPDRISCGRFADGKTSIGKNAWRMNGVATCSQAIPYGATVEIPGIGQRVVDDTGSGMRRSWRRGIYHIDLRMTYPYQCRRWGVRWMNVKLYRPKAL